MQKTLLFPRAILGSASVVLGLSVLAGPAFAGFEWIPSGSQQAQIAPQTSAPPVQSAPLATVQKTTPLDSMPYVTVDQPAPIAQIPTPPPESSSAPSIRSSADSHIIMGAPARNLSLPAGMTEEAASAAPASMAPMPMATMSGSDKPLRGFASNVPLTVALRQVLPADYSYSLAKDVEVGALVSWRGGASWRQTLSTMLAANGLTMQEDGHKIKVARLGSKAAPADMTAKAEPAPLPPIAEPAPMVPMAPVADMPATEAGKPIPLTPSSSSTLDKQLAAMGGSSNLMIEETPDMPVLSNQGVAPTAAPATMPGATWQAERGDTLRKTLETWGKRANVEIVWQAEYDYPLQTSVVLSGSFEEAARSILAGFQDAQPQPVGALHNTQSAGGAVLVVQTRGNNYSD